MKTYTCTNCLWEGTTDEMDCEGDYFLCPTCCAVYDPNDVNYGVWEEHPLSDVPDDELLDYDEWG